MKQKLFSLFIILSLGLALSACSELLVAPGTNSGNNSGGGSSSENPGDSGNSGGTGGDNPSTGEDLDNSGETEQDSSIIFKPFDAGLYFGRSKLTADEQKAYDLTLKRLLDYSDSSADVEATERLKIDLDGNGIKNIKDVEQLNKTMTFLEADDPRLFHIESVAPMADATGFGTTYTRNAQGGISYFYIRIKYAYENYDEYKKEMQAIELRVKPLLAMIEDKPSLTEAQKAKILHDNFLVGVAYGNMDGTQAGYITGAFSITSPRDGTYRLVCEGYSHSYLYLLQRAGIMAIYTPGIVITSTVDNTQILHAWNKVRINNKWYNVDSTWDDAMSVYDTGSHTKYFMKSDADFIVDHIKPQIALNGSEEIQVNYLKYSVNLPTSLESLPESDYQ